MRRNNGKSSKKRQSLYSIEFSHPVDTILDYELESGRNMPAELSPKPMTPRRVKRRSVMTRGNTSRQSGTSRRSHASTSNRNSTRASRRKVHQNPVTKLMDYQQSHNPQPHQSGHSSQYFQHSQPHRLSKSYVSSQHSDNSNLMKSNLKHLNADIPSVNLNKSFRKPSNFTQNVAPDPIYYNMSQSSTFIDSSWNTASTANLRLESEPHSSHGHYNPTYQHSTPNLVPNPEHVDEVYNHRPPSVRSSYSNFHGTRPLSTSIADSENVFVGLNSGQAGTAARPARSQPVPVPKLPSRQSVSRESLQSMSFLNNGPPAYNLNYHTPPDSNSETTM